MPHEIEAHPAHSARVQRLELTLGRFVSDHRHAAPGAARFELPGPGDRIEHRAIVCAMAARLYEHRARNTQMLVQRAQLLLRGVGWRVAALGRVGKLRSRAEDVTVRVARA